MAQEYTGNLIIGGLTLEINPESYVHHLKKYGSYKRTIGGGIREVDANGYRLEIKISGLSQSQIEDIKRRSVLNKTISFVDYIPIAEKNQRTRTVFEDLGSDTIEGELIYLYIPTYQIVIFDFSQEYSNNVVSYVISGEEL